MAIDLKYDQTTHFEFGKNWQNYLQTLTEEKIVNAQKDLATLIPDEELKGKTFFDIGSGSGLHSYCALKMGVKSLTAMDFDPDSVEATKSLLSRLWQKDNYNVFEGNVLQVDLGTKFEVVYSWGVLHHTGAMWEAIGAASRYVAPKGTFVIAIYQKTYCCGIWKVLKKFYSEAEPPTRLKMERIFTFLQKLKLRLMGKSPTKYIANYNKQRGMNWNHDIIDWLGGFPYESATPKEVISFVEKQGFKFKAGRNLNQRMPFGFFGSGCGEFVFIKT